jgi:hypothetical protein
MATRKKNSPRIGPDTVIRTGRASDFAPVGKRYYPWEALKAEGDCFVIEGLTETFGIKPPKDAPFSVKTWIADEGMVVERVAKRPSAPFQKPVGNGYAALLAANPPVPGTGNVFDAVEAGK